MNESYQNYNNANNFDPNQLANQTSTVILFVAVIDNSPSIQSYVQVMNEASEDVFINELKNCHRKDDIMVKCIEFNNVVNHKSGFLPILNAQQDYFQTHPSGNGTALYQAVKEALESAISYRTDLEAQGIEVRTALFIVTDGEDNEDSRGQDAAAVKKIVEDLRSNEAWISSFTINMMGVGRDSNFRKACTEMGLDPDKCLVTVGTSGHEIRQHMGVISQSISSSSAGQSVSF